MFCNYCGAPNPDDASFCSACGKASARSSANVAAQKEVSQKLAPASSRGATPVAATEGDSQVGESARSRTLTGHTLPIWSLSFSHDSRWLASGSSDKTAKLWDVRDGREVRTFTGTLDYTCVEFSPDGRRLVLAASTGPDKKPINNVITLWDSANPNEVRNFFGHQGRVSFVKFSPDGRWLASTDGAGLINLWDVTSGRIIKAFKQSWFRSKLLGGTVGSSLAFSPDGRFLATRSSPATLWDLSSGKEVRSFGPDASRSFSMFLGFTPDGQSLVQARADGSIKIWDVPSGKEARCLADPPQKSGVTFGLLCAALSPDGSLLAVSTWSSGAETSEITLWDILAGRILGGTTVQACGALAFSPDGQWLAVGDAEYGGGDKDTGKIRLWMLALFKDLFC